jgi:hypothetical protein
MTQFRAWAWLIFCTVATLSASLAWTSPSPPLSRLSFVSHGAAVALGLVIVTTPAIAKDADLAIKGTKKDPAYEVCIGQCMYDCTKNKGTEQKSRQECLPECKQKCATTKQQLMVGTPLKKD